ncbi:MAG: uroporphyrinogen decarboxylase/cobalamine-independent methonine synthase family protein [Armatimonadota bacterium]
MAIEHDITAATEELAAQLAAHPERNSDLAHEYVLRGEPRPYPVFYLWRQADIDAGEGMVRQAPPVRNAEERLLDKLRGATRGLANHNPISARFGIGKGTGTLPASFGIFLDPELGYTPKGSRPLDEVLAEGMPDPETSGIIPEMREDIETTKRLTPDWVGINLPDMQGPFNIAHMILGDEAFFAPYEEPEKFRQLLDIISDFWLAVHANLRKWIGEARFASHPAFSTRITECSVNMVSTDMYLEHILPHDLKIARAFGAIAVHPCSGPHVFHATLNNLPNVVYHEAGFIAKTAAGSITPDEALAAIGDRPIILSIGQELPEGEEEEFIRRDLDRAKTNPRLTFGYTGMHWKTADEAMIREMHLRLDAYWEERVAK